MRKLENTTLVGSEASRGSQRLQPEPASQLALSLVAVIIFLMSGPSRCLMILHASGVHSRRQRG